MNLLLLFANLFLLYTLVENAMLVILSTEVTAMTLKSRACRCAYLYLLSYDFIKQSIAHSSDFVIFMLKIFGSKTHSWICCCCVTKKLETLRL